MAAPTRPGLRRRIPSVDALLRSEPGRRAMLTFGRPLLKQVIVEALADVRAAAASGTDPPADDVILAQEMTSAAAAATGLGPVLNATGVVLHTGLGRAPLPEDAVRALALQYGVREQGTAARVAALQRLGRLDEVMARDLVDALHLLMGVRLNHQLQQRAAGQVASN